MRNVTISLREETARWARVEAARQDISVSAFVSRLLDDQMAGQTAYAAARERWRTRVARPISDGSPYPQRDELYDRAGLR